MADAKQQRGLLIMVAGFIIEAVAIVLMFTKAMSPAIAIAQIAIGVALIAVGLGTLRKNRDEHALKRPPNPI